MLNILSYAHIFSIFKLNSTHEDSSTSQSMRAGSEIYKTFRWVSDKGWGPCWPAWGGPAEASLTSPGKDGPHVLP